MIGCRVRFWPVADIAGLAYHNSRMYLTTSEVRMMADRVASHYSRNLKLADAIAEKLRSAGKDPNKLTTADLVAVDEFHIRGRKATLELGEKMNLNARSHDPHLP